MRESVVLPNPADVAKRVSFKGGAKAGQTALIYAQERIESQKQLKHAIALWAGIRKDAGQSDKQSYREFFLTFGVDVVTCQGWKRKEMDALRERIESTWETNG